MQTGAETMQTGAKTMQTGTSDPQTTSPKPTGGLAHRLAEGDARLDHMVGRLRGRPVVDRIAYGISEAANHSALWHGINLIDTLVGVAQHDQPRRRQALRRSVVQGIEQGIVNGPVKAVVKRKRPTHDLAHPHQLRVPVTSSFPSGHASAGACAAELLTADLGHRRVWWILAILVGWSRVHVGVHHPSDVLAGWVIGATSAHTARRLWAPPDVDTTADPTRSAVR